MGGHVDLCPISAGWACLASQQELYQLLATTSYQSSEPGKYCWHTAHAWSELRCSGRRLADILSEPSIGSRPGRECFFFRIWVTLSTHPTNQHGSIQPAF